MTHSSPIDRGLLDPRPPHHVGVLADHAAAQGDALADEDPVVHHRAVDERALLDHHVGADHAVLAQVRARLDLGVLADGDRAGQHRVRVHLGALGDPDAGRELEPGDVGVDLAVEHVRLRLEVGLERADVLPVLVGHVAEDRGAALQQLGEHVVRPVDRLLGRDLRQHLGLHDVDAGVHRVGEHLPPGRLLQEPLDPAVLVGDHDAELERVGHPGEADRDQRAVVLVEPDHLGQVHVGQRVAGDDQERVVLERVLGVLDRAGRAERRLLRRVLQRHADVLAVAEVVPHQRRQELDGDDRLLHPVPLQQPEHVLHDRPVHHRQQRLGLVGGHRAEPGALAACHHDGLHDVAAPFTRSLISLR